jgi:hypothetical protein
MERLRTVWHSILGCQGSRCSQRDEAMFYIMERWLYYSCGTALYGRPTVAPCRARPGECSSCYFWLGVFWYHDHIWYHHDIMISYTSICYVKTSIWLHILGVSQYLTHATGILHIWNTCHKWSNTELHNELEEKERNCRCMRQIYDNGHMGHTAWNLPYDRAWEKAPPYDRAWKKTSHILGIWAHIPSIELHILSI